MVSVDNYREFIGRHWETGSVCNFYANRGVKAPHTGQPYSEALLLGVSGGIVMGYFSFAYAGYDPHVAILTRNTFDPLDRLLERLGVEQEIRQTSDAARGLRNLLGVLENGLPAIVWVDIFSLPYLELANEDDMYLMYPIVVYAYDEDRQVVKIADRSQVPLQVTPEQLARARARVKKEKFRVLTLGQPDPKKLPSAVSKGIWDTLRLFTDQPPKGSRENFGLAAYRRWREVLLNPKASNSWARVFPPGRPMLAGLITAYFSIALNGEGSNAERGTYADFLQEAAEILQKPGLRDAAGQFRDCASAWEDLGLALLPDAVEPLGEIRRLMLRRKRLFLEQGGASVEEVGGINRQIRAYKDAASADFPLEGARLTGFLENLADRIMRVHDLEKAAVEYLQAVMLA